MAEDEKEDLTQHSKPLIALIVSSTVSLLVTILAVGVLSSVAFPGILASLFLCLSLCVCVRVCPSLSLMCHGKQ